jgi:membrane-associated HD superfamily phosphohydrolase
VSIYNIYISFWTHTTHYNTTVQLQHPFFYSFFFSIRHRHLSVQFLYDGKIILTRGNQLTQMVVHTLTSLKPRSSFIYANNCVQLIYFVATIFVHVIFGIVAFLELRATNPRGLKRKQMLLLIFFDVLLTTKIFFFF